MKNIATLYKNLSLYFFDKSSNNTIKGHTYPSEHNALDLGSPSLKFRTVYAENLVGSLVNFTGTIYVDASDQTDDFISSKLIVDPPLVKQVTGSTDRKLNLSISFGSGLTLVSNSLTVDSTVVRTSRQINTGNGLTGGGSLNTDLTISVNLASTSGLEFTSGALRVRPGDGIQLTASGTSVDSSVVRTTRQINTGLGLIGGGDLSANRTIDLADSVAGNGLTISNKVISVGAGAMITVTSTTVGITSGSPHQFIGTGSSTSPGWINLSSIVGNGLSFASGVISLTTPGTLNSNTTNSNVGNHTHAITVGAPSTLSPGTVNVTGTAAGLARADHIHAVPTAAAVTISATTSNAEGTSSSFARADHTHSIPTSSASSLSASTTNTTGSSSSLARADHTHQIVTSFNPGASEFILRTSPTGSLQLVTLASNVVFASGFTGSGYRIDYGITEPNKSSAEFDNLVVRGRMSVYELLIQQIRATNGSVFVSSGSKVVQSQLVNSIWEVDGGPLDWDDNSPAEFDAIFYQVTTNLVGDDSYLYHGFLYGDLIRTQMVRWNGNQFFEVTRKDLEVTEIIDLYNYLGVLLSGTAPAVGDDFVRLGSTENTNRRGSVYLTADDSNAPFIDIVDGVSSFAMWNSPALQRTRLGRLTGITDPDFGGNLEGYGLYADNAYIKGKVVVSGGNVVLVGGAAADVNNNATTIDGGKITTNTITAAQIAANTITAEQIAAGTITGNEIAAGTITASHINVNSLSAISANMGSLVIDSLLTIATSGEIRQGTGTFPTSFTGLRIWNDTNVGRIAGYNAGTIQWSADTSGKLTAASGNLVLDTMGVTFSSSSLQRVRIGSLNGIAGYGPNTFGYAAGNNLALTPATGFSGITVEASAGAKLINTDFLLYDGSQLVTKITPLDGISFIDASSNWYVGRFIEWRYPSISQDFYQSIMGYRLSATGHLTLYNVAVDSYAPITLISATQMTTSTSATIEASVLSSSKIAFYSEQAVATGRFAIWDYNYTPPGIRLYVESNSNAAHALAVKGLAASSTPALLVYNSLVPSALSVGDTVGINVAFNTSHQLRVVSGSASRRALTVKAAASPAVPVFEVLDSTDNHMFVVSPGAIVGINTLPTNVTQMHILSGDPARSALRLQAHPFQSAALFEVMNSNVSFIFRITQTRMNLFAVGTSKSNSSAVIDVPSVAANQSVRIDLTLVDQPHTMSTDVRLIISRYNNSGVWGECTGTVVWSCHSGTNNGVVRANKLTHGSSATSSLSVTAIQNGIRIQFSPGALSATADRNSLLISTVGLSAEFVNVSVSIV